jgi:hypothetical protein
MMISEQYVNGLEMYIAELREQQLQERNVDLARRSYLYALLEWGHNIDLSAVQECADDYAELVRNGVDISEYVEGKS